MWQKIQLKNFEPRVKVLCDELEIRIDVLWTKFFQLMLDDDAKLRILELEVQESRRLGFNNEFIFQQFIRQLFLLGIPKHLDLKCIVRFEGTHVIAKGRFNDRLYVRALHQKPIIDLLLKFFFEWITSNPLRSIRKVGIRIAPFFGQCTELRRKALRGDWHHLFHAKTALTRMT